MATNLIQIENDSEIKKRLETERARLRKIAGLDAQEHFHRPIERSFTAEERSKVTILFGGFTWKHEDLIRGIPGVRISLREAAHTGCACVSNWQGVRQQRPMQSDVFHGWKSGAVSPIPRERGPAAQ